MRRTILVLVSVVAAMLLVVTPALAAPAPQPASAPPAWGAPGYHVVRPGETVFSIGRLYGVNPWTISAANGLPNANRIYAGQRLYIPGGRGYPPPYGSHPYGSYYCVRLGDTLHSIGRAYGVSPWSIASANGIYDLNRIYAGQRLVIPRR